MDGSARREYRRARKVVLGEDESAARRIQHTVRKLRRHEGGSGRARVRDVSLPAAEMGLLEARPRGQLSVAEKRNLARAKLSLLTDAEYAAMKAAYTESRASLPRLTRREAQSVIQRLKRVPKVPTSPEFWNFPQYYLSPIWFRLGCCCLRRLNCCCPFICHFSPAAALPPMPRATTATHCNFYQPPQDEMTPEQRYHWRHAKYAMMDKQDFARQVDAAKTKPTSPAAGGEDNPDSDNGDDNTARKEAKALLLRLKVGRLERVSGTAGDCAMVTGLCYSPPLSSS